MKYFCTSPGAAPFTLLNGGVLSSPGGFVHLRRILDQRVLILVRKGVLHMVQDGCPLTVKAGEYLFLYEGMEHAGTKPSEGELLYDWIHFAPPPGDFFARETLPREPERYLMPETGKMHPSGRLLELSRMLLDFLQGEPLPEGGQDCGLTLLLAVLSREFSQWESREQPVSPVVLQAAEWVRRNFHRGITVSDAAEAFGYSAEYLSSLFRQQMGMPLARFIIQTRMQAARSLLREYGVSVREAALSCGFSDEHYFIRRFRREEGVTPGAYRRACQLSGAFEGEKTGSFQKD